MSVAVVGGEDHQGVLQVAALVQRLHDLTDLVVDHGHVGPNLPFGRDDGHALADQLQRHAVAVGVQLDAGVAV
jgi:hypothetical protein